VSSAAGRAVVGLAARGDVVPMGARDDVVPMSARRDVGAKSGRLDVVPMSARSRLGRVSLAVAGAVVLVGASGAPADAIPVDPPTGGAVPQVAEREPLVVQGSYGAPAPVVDRIVCRAACAEAGVARPGAVVRVLGKRTQRVAEVLFLAGPGEADDTSAAPRRVTPRAVFVRVPRMAASGPVALALADGTRSAASHAPLIVDASDPVAPSAPIDAEVQGQKVFYDAQRPAELSYVLGGSEPATVTVSLVRVADDVVIERWTQTGVVPGIPRTLTWNGIAGGHVQRDGVYRFRVEAIPASAAAAAPTATAAPDEVPTGDEAGTGGGVDGPAAIASGVGRTSASGPPEPGAAGADATGEQTPEPGDADLAQPGDAGGAEPAPPDDAGGGDTVPPGDAGGSVPARPGDASGGDPVPPGDASGSVPVVPVGGTLVSDGDTGSFTFQRHRFPIVGAHTFGTGAAAFGGGRGHQGQDVFAECGTPIVAARGGRVKVKQYEGRAGNYVVIDGAATGVDFAYMHLRDEALVDEGDRVRTGQLIGFVGDTGRADGCHLHFEMWTGPGWYAGGAPFDPLPELRAWDALS